MKPTEQRDGSDDSTPSRTGAAAKVVRVREYLTALGSRTKSLRSRTEAAPSSAQALILEMLEEIQNNEEELSVVDEEMRRQSAELVRARAESEASVRHYRELFEMAPDAYLVTDAQGTVREANVGAARLFNIRASFLTGKPLVGFVARQDCRRFRAVLSELASAPHSARVELRLRPRHGMPVFTGDISASALRGAGGRGASIRWTVRDVSTRAPGDRGAVARPGSPGADASTDDEDGALRRRAERQARLVDDLVAIVTDAHDEDREALALDALVERAVVTRSPSGGADPRVQLSVEGERCRVVVHADRLVLAAGALLDDALDAEGAEAGARAVKVCVAREGAHATVRIRHAHPLPPDAVGLPVARRILAAHGGTLTTTFDAQRGSETRLALPLSGAVAAMSPHPVVSLEATHADLRDVKVLVVEDDDDSRDLLLGVLADAGAEVREASTVEAALATVTDWRPDVLVSDIGLPGQDGYALVRQLRALGRADGGDVPAIALSGFAELDDTRRALAAGFQVHVGKPIDPALLTHAVANVAGMKIASTPPDDEETEGSR